MQSSNEIGITSSGGTTNSVWSAMSSWLPAALYAGIIFYLSHQPHPEEQLPEFLFTKVSDKLVHAVEYGILALLCYRAFRRSAGMTLASYAVLSSIVAASLYGASDELHQLFVPFREASPWDWLADTAGAAMAAIGANLLLERHPFRSTGLS